ncbi:MAG TPA: hypothetical protein VLJ37_12570 [bacterium]|nr:hypothetical protein [bacterium]
MDIVDAFTGAGVTAEAASQLRSPNGSVLSGLKAKTDEAMDGEAFLGGLVGICNPLKNDLVSKPAIVSAELKDYERIESEGLKAGEQTCSMTCPDGYFVSGMRYGRSHEFDDGTRGVTGAVLLCKSVRHPADSVAVDLYDTQGTCGGDLYDYYDQNGDIDYTRKFSSRTVLFTGFGAHAVYLRTGKQSAYDQIRAMGFFQTPVDLSRQVHPVWVGAYWSFLSALAGNGPGAEQVLSCPTNKILTAVEFRTGETLKLTGVKSYTCAGVKVGDQ